MGSVSRQRRGRGPEPGIRTRDEGDDSPNRTADDTGLSDDEMFRVLSNRRRRLVIEYLRGEDGTATVGELAEHIACEEEDTTIQRLTSHERKRVYVSLYQNHLPVMDDADIVDYDKNRKTVRLRDAAAKLEPYLADATGRGENPVPVVAALLVSAAVLFGSFQVGPFAVAPASAWALVGLVGLVGMTCVDLYDRRSE